MRLNIYERIDKYSQDEVSKFLNQVKPVINYKIGDDTN